MTIENKLTASVANAIKTLYGQEVDSKQVQLQKTRKEYEGNLTVVVFPFLRISKKKPDATATEIGDYLKQQLPDIVERYNVVGGFLNLVLNQNSWVGMLNQICNDPDYGITPATEASPLVMIEYSSPNTNKPLHLGHVRNNLLGSALARIVEACGNKVVKTNIVNDRGIHICKSMLAWLKWGNGATPESTGRKATTSSAISTWLSTSTTRLNANN